MLGLYCVCNIEGLLFPLRLAWRYMFLLPVVRLDKLLKVRLVDTIEDVVAVGGNKVMVGLNLLLQSIISNNVCMLHKLVDRQDILDYGVNSL